jgi:hypothetical protein
MTGSARDKAVSRAQFYFRLIGSQAGVDWCGDNDTEVEELIDFITDAAAEKAGNHPERGMNRQPGIPGVENSDER